MINIFKHSKKKQLAEIRNEARRDYLTGLANRRGLYEYYESLRKDKVIHAMFVDIDNFKSVNDVYGHSMGDKMIVEIGRLIEKTVDGFISRIGGDEYVIILDGSLNEKELTDIAAELIENMSNIDFRRDILSLISLSIGIVMEQVANAELDEVLKKCDEAMYQAKYDGKNRYYMHKAYDEQIEINKNIEIEMESALLNGEFHVFLQPKVNMVSGKLYGAEALSRWIHPKDGLRPPYIYISLFEKNGFISKLDMYVFEEVCRIKKEWKGREYEHIPISANMSRLHLYDKEFPDKLVSIANKYNIDPSELEIEITENVFIKDTNELIRVVKELKKRGFLVSIDDFGSGFSALNLLKDIPVDIIKIDREFLKVSSDNNRGKKVIRNVIAMCKDLKLDVVTEGIETKEQVDFITKCSCQVAQGFYYSKPIPVDEFEKFAEERSINVINSFTFHFDGDLKCEEERFEGFINGEGIEFVDGVRKGTKAVRFPGGEPEKNTIFLPNETIVNESFTISMWVRPKENALWSSILYVKFESGFLGLVPYAWEGKESDVRIRDSRQVGGWYDVHGPIFAENEWTHCAVVYNAKTEKLESYINGKKVGELMEVPTNMYVKWIILGGDVFRQSFKGDICDLIICNEAKSELYIRELYKYYQTENV